MDRVDIEGNNVGVPDATMSADEAENMVDMAVDKEAAIEAIDNEKDKARALAARMTHEERMERNFKQSEERFAERKANRFGPLDFNANGKVSDEFNSAAAAATSFGQIDMEPVSKSIATEVAIGLAVSAAVANSQSY